MSDERKQEPAATTGGDDDDDIVLPDRRAVNRQISEEMRREREAARSQRQRGASLWVMVAQEAERRMPGDIHGQLRFVLRYGPMPASIGRERAVSEATRTMFGNDCRRAFNELREERANVRNLSELTRKHVLRLVKRWVKEGRSQSTIANRVTHLRKLLVLLGKPRAIPTEGAWKKLLAENGIDANALARSQIRVVPKAICAAGIDPQELIDRVATTHPREALLLELQWRFGLRPKESVEMDAVESDNGDIVLVLHGSKGNRRRSVKLSSDPERRAAQRELLERVKLEAVKHGQRRIRERGLTVEQALNRFYYAMRKHGITAKGNGVVAYGFRHEFANAEFEEICGLPAPVLRKVPVTEYEARAQKVAEAEQHVVVQMGHSKKEKSRAYLGSHHFEKRRHARQMAVLNLVRVNLPIADAVREGGISEVWVVGKAAAGEKLTADAPIELALRMPSALTMPALQTLVQALDQALKALPRPATLTWCTERPESALEVVFDYQRNAK